MLDATASLMRSGISADDLTTDLMSQYMYGPTIPPVDFVIRTSGEQRLSGFMLWSAAYAEVKFILKYWPAFTITDLDEALGDYANRQRRFGV